VWGLGAVDKRLRQNWAMVLAVALVVSPSGASAQSEHSFVPDHWTPTSMSEWTVVPSAIW
jgi:hypothetical protein